METLPQVRALCPGGTGVFKTGCLADGGPWLGEDEGFRTVEWDLAEVNGIVWCPWRAIPWPVSHSMSFDRRS